LRKPDLKIKSQQNFMLLRAFSTTRLEQKKRGEGGVGTEERDFFSAFSSRRIAGVPRRRKDPSIKALEGRRLYIKTGFNDNGTVNRKRIAQYHVGAVVRPRLGPSFRRGLGKGGASGHKTDVAL